MTATATFANEVTSERETCEILQISIRKSEILLNLILSWNLRYRSQLDSIGFCSRISLESSQSYNLD